MAYMCFCLLLQEMTEYKKNGLKVMIPVGSAPQQIAIPQHRLVVPNDDDDEDGMDDDD